ncbi:MAG: hypothetical protein DMG80_16305 [Acidobacteria bacterium]|jgi:hypothetical protein|nr:MAG: hypothetical protein DMG80_16305 [Acidobacteriota bacterium]
MFKLFFAVFSLSLFAAAPDEVQPASIDQSNSPALTIYNQNFFVAREHLPLDLNAGVNHVNFAGISAHLEPDSVILRDLTGRPLQILEQSYRNDPVSQELLLSFYEGKTLDFAVGRNADGSDIRMPGKVIRSGYIPMTYINGYPQQTSTQPIIEINGILRFGLPGEPRFPALSSDSILKPTLSWALSTTQAGKTQAELSYVSGGMTWQSDYNLVVADGPRNTGMNSLDLVGWITMRNQSGKTFENARVKLMAGDVSKIQAGTLARNMYLAEDKAMRAEAAAPVVREKSFDEFHLYTLERPATLRDNETKQVEFVRTAGIQSQRLYVYDGAQIDQYGYYNYDQVRNDPGYGTASNSKVWVLQEFKNSDTNHLGIALPKGRLRFYRRDSDGSLQFVGENTIDHTPKDEMIRVYTGNAFDIVGERKRTNYRVDSNARWMDETFEIRVRNHKKEAANVRVVEHLYRWTNWQLSQQSSQFKKRDAQTIEFPVNVAPDGEQVVTYTVHYSW